MAKSLPSGNIGGISLVIVMRNYSRIAYHYSWLLLATILPVVAFITPQRAVVLGLLPVPFVLRWIGWGRPFPQTPFNTSLLLLAIMVGVSVVITPDFSFSLPKVAGLLFGITTYFLTVDQYGMNSTKKWWIIALFASVGYGLIGIGMVAGYPPLMQKMPIAIPLAVNLNEVAGIITWILPLLIVLMLYLGRLKPLFDSRIGTFWAVRILLLILSVSLLPLLYITKSRSAWAGCLASILLILFYAVRRYRFLFTTLLFLMVMSILVAIFWIIWLNGATTEAISLTGRQEIWSRAIYGIQDFPFTGMGMNSFRRVVNILYPLFNIDPNYNDLGHAHNQFLQAALDLGIPGLIAYLSLWIGSVQLLWKSKSILALGVAASLLAHFAFGLTDAIALGAKVAFLQWILFGLVAGIGIEKESLSDDKMVNA